MKRVLAVVVGCFLVLGANVAYSGVWDKVKSKTQERLERKTDEGIDAGLDAVEEGLTKDEEAKDKEAKDKEQEEEKGEEQRQEDEQQQEQGQPRKAKQGSTTKPVQSGTQTASKSELMSFSKYDFIPGDKVIYFEDFSQDSIGDFPALWNTDKSGEVITTNNYPGNWFKMKEEGLFWWEKTKAFPTNFTLEFDVIPMPWDSGEEAQSLGFDITLLETEEGEPYPTMCVPGKGGVVLNLYTPNGQHSISGYASGYYGMRGDYDKAIGLLTEKQLNHISIWVQKTRMRVYIHGEKVFDLPKVLDAGLKLNQLRFWTVAETNPLFTNIRIAEATGDMRSKLLTEGKIVSHGIYFDSGSDKVKPESYGSLKEIAYVLKENPTVRIKIVGHTDSDGDDKFNLELSKRRAASVKNSFVKDFQIDATRMETDGKGESEPLSDNKTKEGKANNRRVEFINIKVNPVK